MRKQADGKVRRSEEEWERIFDRFHSSGMTGAAFCRREKIAKGSFEKWKKKIGRRSKAVAVAPTFVEWPAPVDRATVSTMTSPPLSSGELELSLPGGVVLRFRS
jgi:hypothetical protein